MSDNVAMVLVTAAIVVPVCAAVSVACYATGSGWPLMGLLVIAGFRIRVSPDAKEPTDD